MRDRGDFYYTPDYDHPRCPLCGRPGLVLTRITELGIPTQNKTIVCRNERCPLCGDPEKMDNWIPEELAGRARQAYHQKLRSFQRKQHLAKKEIRMSLGQLARRAREKTRA